MSTKRIYVYAAAVLLLSRCYYDHEGILYPETANCTPSDTPSFSKDVLPLLNVRCNNCHAGAYPSGGITLDSHGAVLKYVSNGSLMGSVKQTSGFSPMPKNSGKLSACEIQKIQTWIDAGTPDN